MDETWLDDADASHSTRVKLAPESRRETAARPPPDDVLGLIAAHMPFTCGVRLALAQSATASNVEARMRWARARVATVADRWPLAWSQRVLDAHVGDIVAFERCAWLISTRVICSIWPRSKCRILTVQQAVRERWEMLTLNPETMRAITVDGRRRDPCRAIEAVLTRPDVVGTRALAELDALMLVHVRTLTGYDAAHPIQPMVEGVPPILGPCVCFNAHYPLLYEIERNGVVSFAQNLGVPERFIKSMLRNAQRRHAPLLQPPS